MILETEGVEPRCEKRLGGGGGGRGGGRPWKCYFGSSLEQFQKNNRG